MRMQGSHYDFVFLLQNFTPLRDEVSENICFEHRLQFAWDGANAQTKIKSMHSEES